MIKKNSGDCGGTRPDDRGGRVSELFGKLFSDKDDTKTAQQANSELLDISEEDIETGSGDIESQDQDASETDGDVEGTPGEAVLTNGEVEKYCGAGKSIQRAGAGEE